MNRVTLICAIVFLLVCTAFLSAWQHRLPKPKPEAEPQVQLIPPIRPEPLQPYDPYSKFVEPLLHPDAAVMEVPR